MRLHLVLQEGKAVCWAHFATICCMNRDQPALSVIKTLCYSSLWAGGDVIENILANEARFVGTIEAGSEHSIMQWNLTGLHGATLAQELINVWGPAGVKCAFVDVLHSQTGALLVQSCHRWRRYREDVKVRRNVAHMSTFWQSLTNDCSNTYTFFESPQGPRFPTIHPVWWSWPTLGTLFPQELPDNVGRKKSSFIGPHTHSRPSSRLWRSSATVVQKLLPQVIYSFSDSILHHPCFCHADRGTLGDTQEWLKRDRLLQGEITFAQIGVPPAFAGRWDNRCIPIWTKSLLLASHKCQNRVPVFSFITCRLTLKQTCAQSLFKDKKI